MIIQPNNCYNIDCVIGMKLMLEQGIKADWCITDPPYGVQYARGENGWGYCNNRPSKEEVAWDKKTPEKEAFDLIREISNSQIIFGGNYFTDKLPPSKCWIVWDKICGTENKSVFADCELAWTSLTQVCRLVSFRQMGFIKDTKDKSRIHPTQKPTELWCKILSLYTKDGDLILDPFAGSQSLRIACHKMNRRYIGFEIDKDYYKKGCQWFESESRQISFF